MIKDKARREYKKPTVELIVFNYSEVVASSDFMGGYSFSDDNGSASETAVAEDNWFEPTEVSNDNVMSVIPSNTASGGDMFTDDVSGDESVE